MVTMSQVMRIAAPGGPDVLKPDRLALSPLGAGEVLLRQTAIGLNYQDVYYRSGAQPLPLPAGIGNEAAGVVEAVGHGVTTCRVGDRVACGSGVAPGAYADWRIAAAHRDLESGGTSGSSILLP